MSLVPRGGVGLAWYLVLTPLPLVYLSSSIDPSVMPRWLWLQFGVTLMMSFSLGRIQDKTAYKHLLYVVGGFVLWSALSILWSSDVGSGFARLVTLLTCGQFLILGLTSSESERPHILRALGLASGIAAVIGTVQAMGLAFPFFDQAHPPASSFVNRNFASEFIGALLPLCLFLLLSEKRPAWVPVWIISCGAACFFVMAARSRATWLALLGALIYLGVLLLRQPQLRDWCRQFATRESASRLLLCAVLIYLVFPGPSRHMREQLQEEVASFSNQGTILSEQVNTFDVRLAMWTNSLAMVMANPLGGAGLDQFPVMYPRYHDVYKETPTFSLEVSPQRLHNDLLQILVELGLPGITLFLTIVWMAGSLKPLTDGSGITLQLLPRLILVVILVNSLFAFPLHLPGTAVLFWLCLGLMQRETEESPKRFPTLVILVVVVFNLVLTGFYGLGVKSGQLRRDALFSLQEQKVEAAYNQGMQAFLGFPFDWRSLDELMSIINARTQVDPRDRALAEAFVKRHPYNANGHYRHAHLLWRLGLHSEALLSMNRAIDLIQDEPRLFLLRAEIHSGLGDSVAAEKDRVRAKSLEATR